LVRAIIGAAGQRRGWLACGGIFIAIGLVLPLRG
jgi:hypothetical protein